MKTSVASFILNSLKPFKCGLSVMLSVSIVWAIDLSLRPYLLKMIIDRLSHGVNTNVFESVGWLAIIYFLMIFTLSTVFRFYDYFVNTKMIPNLRTNLANNSVKKLFAQSYSYYQNNFAGSLTNKTNDLSASVPEITQIIIDSFFSKILAISIAIYTLWQVNYVFALTMLCWVGFFITGSIIISFKLSKISDAWSEYGSALTGKLVDSLSNILAINLFARKQAEAKLLSTAINHTNKAEEKFQWIYFCIFVFYGYSFIILQGVSLYLLLKGIENGSISVGDFVIVLGINSAVVDFLWQSTKDFSQFSRLWGKIAQALRAIQVEPEIQDHQNATDLLVKKGEIRFDKVKFYYKGTEPLFNNKSITIEAGQKVGLVGYSGSGKTTFVNLILRLYEVTEGRILIDNQNISEITQDSLHRNIGMIPQDPSLFHRSLIDNIRYGQSEASDAEVIVAAQRAHAHDFIMDLPEQYDSLVGERGVKLSGGQRQRIAMARAFLKNAPILILDEATSQLDSLTEVDIQASLWELMQNKTTIIIAHRLSTLLDMDRILVFDRGKIVQDGSHQELLKQDGLYASLWSAQVGGFIPESR